MKKYILIFAVIFSAIFSFAQERPKLAQTGCQFLSIGEDARATSMAEAFTSVEGLSTSLLYNPAGMATLPGDMDLSFGYTSWIADMKHYTATFAYKPGTGNYGVIGLSIMYVDYGDFQWTIVDPKSSAGYFDLGSFTPKAYSIGLGYAIQLSDKFSIGGQAKYVYESLGSNFMDPVVGGGNTKNWMEVMAFDFGTRYWTGYKSLAFGMSVRNFSKQLKFQSEPFQLPLTFKIGISIDAFDVFMEKHDDHKFLVTVDAVHPRDYTEQVNLGVEYGFMDMVYLRGGYMFNNDEHGITGGIGVKKLGFAVDYGYTPFGVFDKVHRLSFRFAM
jgi:hypothetical protein